LRGSHLESKEGQLCSSVLWKGVVA
jgi:hypothetical protein